MPWSYDPSRPPGERYQEWPSPDQLPEPTPPTWPGQPRHARTDDTQLAVEQARADRVRTDLIALLHDALTRLDQL